MPKDFDYLVGYGRADVSPWMPVPLRGYGNEVNRMSEEVLDPVYATAVAVTGQNGKSVLFIGMDLCRVDACLSDMQAAALRGVNYELTADDAAGEYGARNLMRGMSGSDVAALQEDLDALTGHSGAGS